MALQYGVDTSILVRLVARKPARDFNHCVRRLSDLVEKRGCRILASNQAIGEAYAALMHHYAISSLEARKGLAEALTSGLVEPLNGRPVLKALAATSAPGLFDRLITIDYAEAGIDTLTLDRKMASLPNAQLLPTAKW